MNILMRLADFEILKEEFFRSYISPIFMSKLNSVAFGPRANYADRATAASWRSSAKFCGQRVLRGQRNGSLRSLISISQTGAATLSSK
jgi:hypothetical protein